MGTQYSMPSMSLSTPTSVEGVRHAVDFRAEGDNGRVILLLLNFRLGTTLLAAMKTRINRDKVLRFGGTQSNWDTILGLAEGNSSDTDDVIEEMLNTSWGAEAMWRAWFAYLGA
jgi:hypothetical protein